MANIIDLNRTSAGIKIETGSKTVAEVNADPKCIPVIGTFSGCSVWNGPKITYGGVSVFHADQGSGYGATVYGCVYCLDELDLSKAEKKTLSATVQTGTFTIVSWFNK
jgi:hypothetical protein